MKNKLETIEYLIRELAFDDSITINEETKLSDIRGWDDLDTAELSISLEDEFDIEFTEEEYDSIKSVGNIIKLIENKTK